MIHLKRITAEGAPNLKTTTTAFSPGSANSPALPFENIPAIPTPPTVISWVMPNAVARGVAS
jgi:hypothetical protein